MSTAQMAIYADTFIEGFEQGVSILRETVNTKVISKGGQFYFLVASSGNRAAVTRGSNGLIPNADDSQTQVPVTLREAHDKQRKNGFDIFRGQADQQAIMRMAGMKTINREIDDAIIAALVASTITTGAAAVFSKTMVNKALTKLGNSFVEAEDGNVFGLLTPAAWAYATDITQFTSSDFTDSKKVDRGFPVGPERVRWMGVWWMKHPRLPGVGTASASCFIWHRDAIGHVVDTANIQAAIGRVEEDDYSFCRHTIYHEAALLQNAGVVELVHDDSALS